MLFYARIRADNCGTQLRDDDDGRPNTHQRYKGYEWYFFSDTPLVGPLLGWADSYTGMTSWRMRFPLVMLRLISFNMDKYWAAIAAREAAATGSYAEADALQQQQQQQKEEEDHVDARNPLSRLPTSAPPAAGLTPSASPRSPESRMQRMHHPAAYYDSFVWYLVYLLYVSGGKNHYPTGISLKSRPQAGMPTSMSSRVSIDNQLHLSLYADAPARVCLCVHAPTFLYGMMPCPCVIMICKLFLGTLRCTSQGQPSPSTPL